MKVKINSFYQHRLGGDKISCFDQHTKMIYCENRDDVVKFFYNSLPTDSVLTIDPVGLVAVVKRFNYNQTYYVVKEENGD